MLTAVNPKLPMRDKTTTHDFYVNKLGFQQWGGDYEDYLMLEKDGIQLHFFKFSELNPKENYGQVYLRTDNIDELYHTAQQNKINYTRLEMKPWQQREFSILDPDNNLLTIGQSVI